MDKSLSGTVTSHLMTIDLEQERTLSSCDLMRIRQSSDHNSRPPKYQSKCMGINTIGQNICGQGGTSVVSEWYMVCQVVCLLDVGHWPALWGQVDGGQVDGGHLGGGHDEDMILRGHNVTSFTGCSTGPPNM